jgi:hypothetical protein
MTAFACAGYHQLFGKLKPAGFLFLLSTALTMTVSAQTFTTLANLTAFNDGPKDMSFIQWDDL